MSGRVRLAALLVGAAVSVAIALYAPGSALGQAIGAKEQSGLAAVETKLTADEVAAFDLFGRSVAISGDTMVVGAPTGFQGADSGAAYIFTRGGAAWTQQAKLTASDAEAEDWFGKSVAISGDTVVVGAPRADDAAEDTGWAYIFTRSGAAWTQQAKVRAGDDALGDRFGASVAISGDTVVVGRSSFLQGEAAYIFVRSGATWTQQAKLTASDAALGYRFGISVAISGDTVVVGASDAGDARIVAGAAYTFTRSGAAWTQQAKLTAGDGATRDYFGGSVAISGDTVVVAAGGDDDAGESSGSAYIFTRGGASWTQQGKLTAGDAAEGDTFGNSVAISGDRVVVGASRHDDAARDAGAAYLFARDGARWTQQLKLTAGDGATDDFFGISVAISGDTVVVGADDDGVALQDIGAAYVFQLIRVGAITGRVTNAASGAGISGATVTTEPSTSAASADASGAFTFSDVPEGTYTVTASAAGFSTESATVLLAAGQTTTANISLTPLAAISLSATAVDCASVEVGQSSTCAVTVTNAGGGTLRGSVRGAGAPFAASPSSYSLRAGGSQIVTISFSPTSAGAFTGTLSFSAGGGASVRVSGEGTAPPPAPEAPHSTFDPATGTLHIPALEVLGRGEVYAVDFTLVPGSEPPTFSLAGARLLDDPPPASSATFDPATGTITISAVEVPGLFGSVQIYVVELALVPFAEQPRVALVDVMLAPEEQPEPRPPSLVALDSTSAEPFQLLTISGSGFDPEGEYSVRFFADQGFTVEVPVVEAKATSLTVGVPPFINHMTGEFASGTVNVQVVQTSATPPLTSDVAAGLEIRNLPSPALPPGEITVAFLDAAVALFQDTLTRLAFLESGSGGFVSSPGLQDLLPKLIADFENVKREVQSIANGSIPAVVFAEYNAQPVRLDVGALAEIDRLVGAIALQAVSDSTAEAALNRHAKPQSALPELRAIETVRRLFSIDDPRGEELRERLRTIGGATSSVVDVNEALATFGVASPLLQVARRLGPLGWVGLTLLPSVLSLAADINAATASAGGLEFDKVQSALNRFAIRTAPSAVTSLLDVVAAGGAPLFSLTVGSAVERLFKNALQDADPVEEVFRLSQATLDCFEGGQCPRSGLTPPLPEPGAARGPMIALSPSALSFTATSGGARPPAQSFTITNTGGAGSVLRFSVADNAAWLSVSGVLDPLAGGASRILAVAVDPAGLSAGAQNGTITVSDANAANSPQTVRVTLTVSAPAPPPIATVALSSTPGLTGFLAPGAQVQFTAVARDRNGNSVPCNAVFAVSNPVGSTVATINPNTGLLTVGPDDGAARVTATCGGVESNAILVSGTGAGSIALVGMDSDPRNTRFLDAGAQVQFTAFARDRFGNIVPCNAVFAVSNPVGSTVATINPNTGLLTMGPDVGAARVTATCGGVETSNPILVSVTPITITSATCSVGARFQIPTNQSLPGEIDFYVVAISGTATGPVGSLVISSRGVDRCSAWTGCERREGEPATTTWTSETRFSARLFGSRLTGSIGLLGPMDAGTSDSADVDCPTS